MKNVFCLLMLFAVLPAGAAILHVGPAGSGYAYSSLQTAWNASVTGDEIIVHAGTYARVGDYSLNTAADGKARSNIYVHSAGDGKAIMQGQIHIATIANNTVGNITIEGLYINPQGVARNAIYVNPGSGVADILTACTFKNNVIYGDFTNSQGIYIRGKLANHSGQHVFENNTIFGTVDIGNGIGIYDRIEGAQDPLTTAPIFKDNIVVNLDTGVKAWYLGMKYEYGLVYGSRTIQFTSSQLKGIGLVEVNPLFYSTDPESPYFLYLSQTSPSSVTGGALDGGYMGALPVYIPEPTTIVIFAAGLLFFNRKK